LKLNLKIDTNYINIHIDLKHMFMAYRPVFYELLALRFERDTRV